MSYRIPIIFDTDIGVDDAFALLLAAGDPNLDLLGITTVFGNNSVDNCTENALRMCELLDLNVPVAKGASKSLFGPARDYSDRRNYYVHGEDGLGGKRYMLKEPRKKVEDCDAVDLIARLIRRSDENARYFRIRERVLSALRVRKEQWVQRKDYKFFVCPACKATLRVPKGRGKIKIVCRKCGNSFMGKS